MPLNIEDFERDMSLTITQFMLSPDIPLSEKVHFEKFNLMFSKSIALGNIKRQDIFALTIAFEEICMLLEIGLYDEARQMMGKELMKMQATRSIDGFQILYGQHGVQRSESLEKIMQRRRSRSPGGRLSGLFKKKKQGEWEEATE